jgi:preprotein translocase subunit SecE
VVYRGGLENRCALKRTGGSNPSLSARKYFNNVKMLPILIGLVIATVIFAIAWRQGAFLKLSGYFDETKEELKKCTWPSMDELKGSTLVVIVAIAVVGLFTMVVDVAIAYLVRSIV